MKIRNNIFINYLFSYIIIMIIPVCILGYILYGSFLGYFTQTLLNNKFHSLSSIRSTIDMEISQLHSYAYRITNSKEFSTTYLNKRYAQFYDVFKSLSNVKYSDDFIYEILYVNTNLGYIYTPDARFTFNNFKTSEYSYNNYSAQQLYDYFSAHHEISWMPVQPVKKNPRQILTYIVPIKNGNTTEQSSILFQIDSARFNQIAGATISEKDSGLLILDKHKNVLYTSGKLESKLPPDFFEAVDKSSENQWTKIKINQKDVLVYSFDSEVSDIRYVSVIAYEEIMKPLRELKAVAIFALLSIVILGSVMIYWFMRKNYTPLHALGKLSKTFLTSSQAGLNEIESTKQALANIAESNQEILSINRKYLKEDLLLKLLRNRFADNVSIKTAAQEIGISLSGPNFRVAVLKLANSLDCKDELYEKIEQLVETTLAPIIEAYTVKYSEDDSIILVLSGEPMIIKSIDKTLSQIQTQLKTDFLAPCIIGMSNVYQELHQSFSHYLEARTTVKYQFMRGNDKIISYRELTSAKAIGYVYPSDEINAVYNAILTGDSRRVEFAIDMLIPCLHNMSSLFLSVCLGYDIVNTALKAMRKCNYPLEELGKKYPDLLTKTEFSSPDEITHVVRKLSIEICESINQTGQPKSRCSAEEDDISAILRYIEEHYTEESFSSKTLSDHFGKSISNFSHYFKSRTGHAVSEYINHKRFEKAKELLRTTDMTIMEIVPLSGYCHVSTFMRQFKQLDGMSPAKYREMYRTIAKNAMTD